MEMGEFAAFLFDAYQRQRQRGQGLKNSHNQLPPKLVASNFFNGLGRSQNETSESLMGVDERRASASCCLFLDGHLLYPFIGQIHQSTLSDLRPFCDSVSQYFACQPFIALNNFEFHGVLYTPYRHKLP
ncbi:MAG: hypothetical protein ABIQ90_00125 [Polaromonas sp.]